MEQTSAQIVFEQKNATYQCCGSWSVLTLDGLPKKFSTSPLPDSQQITINGEKISVFDSAGALALKKCIDELKKEITRLN